MKPTDTYLSLVKSTNSFVSEFVGTTGDPCFTKGIMYSSPTVYKQGNSFFFDYSSTPNSSDLKFLKKFFGSLTPGATFTVSGGTYYSETTKQQYNFSGQYTLIGATGSYKNYLNLSGNTYPPSLVNGVYKNSSFVTPMNYTAVSGATAQYFISKVNKEDPFNIDYLGIYGNDYGYEEYLELTGCTLNPGRLKINSSLKLNDESEIIYLNAEKTIINENLYFIPVTANIYMRGVPDLTTLSANIALNGLLKKVDENGNTLEIFDNQNLRQRYCRNANDRNYYYDWFAMHETSNFLNIYNPLAYNGLSLSITYFSLAKIVIVNVYDAPLTSDQQEAISETYALVIDGVQTNSVIYSSVSQITNPILKIDLSDSSLYAATVEPFIDSACSVKLQDSYFLNGVPGFDGASFIYLKGDNDPSVIYLKFYKEVPLVLSIQV